MPAGLGDDFQPALDSALHNPAIGNAVKGDSGGCVLNSADRVANVAQSQKDAAWHVKIRAVPQLRSEPEALCNWPAASHRVPSRGYR